MRLLRRAIAMSAGVARSLTTSRVTGLAPGPYAVGVRTIQLTDDSRQEDGAPRRLQTEIWYPAAATGKPSKFADFLCGGELPSPEIIQAAEQSDAIGGAARQSMARADGSRPLVALLGNREPRVVRSAAGALSILALDAPQRKTILAAGGAAALAARTVVQRAACDGQIMHVGTSAMCLVPGQFSAVSANRGRGTSRPGRYRPPDARYSTVRRWLPHRRARRTGSAG